jgi:type IV pilus assembly protein PilO
MPQGQRERLWLFGGGLAAFVMLLAGYLLFIGPQRSQTADVKDQISSAQLQQLSLQQRINELRAQSKNAAKYESALQQARLALPSTSGMPDFLRSLQSIGRATLTNVSSLTVGAPTAPTSAPAASQPTPGAASTSAAPSATPQSGTAQPAPGGAAPASTAQVYALPITAEVSGSTAALERFLTQLQTVQPRAVLISSVTLTSGTGTSAHGATLELTMQAFVAPTAQTPATQPPGPQPTAVAQK